MRIVDIERHVICPPFQAWNEVALARYQGPQFQHRVVFVARTDNGLEGLAEDRGRVSPGSRSGSIRLRGTDPFDWLAHPELPVPLGPATTT